MKDSGGERRRLSEITVEVCDDQRALIIAHLQDARERERSSVARALHDDLGGLLVSAVMDLGWAEQRLAADEGLRQRLIRVRDALSTAIDLKRAMIEDLRPSLLDTIGLFAACRWHGKQRGEAAGVAYTDSYPAEELRLIPAAGTGLFRIMQETLAVIFTETSLKAVHVSIVVDANLLRMEIAHEHAASEVIDVFESLPLQMGAIVQRVGSLGGKLTVTRRKEGTSMSADVPIERAVA